MVEILIDRIFKDMTETIREPLLVLDSDLRVILANPSFFDLFKVTPEETVGQLIYDIGNKQWDIPRLLCLLETILPEKTSFDNYEVEHDFATIGRRSMLLNARQVEQAMGSEQIILLAIKDITELKNAEDILKKNEQRYKTAQRMGRVGNWEYDLVTERFWGSDEAKRLYGFDPDDKTFSTDKIEKCIPDRERVHQALMDLIDKGTPYDLEFEIRPISGPKRKIIKSLAEIQTDDSGRPCKILGVIQDITKQKEEESSLKAIEWLLKKPTIPTPDSPQGYSDLTELNTCRIILDNIGKDILSDIVTGYLELLESAAAIYEKNGDYAHGIFSSSWCRMLDSASRKLCNTPDDRDALSCGKWLCHESCWTDASKIAIDTGQPVDIECNGGIRLYAIPITAHEEVIGCINFGYGDPPRDPAALETISKKYQLDVNELENEASRYEHRPDFIIEIAKKRLHGSAKLIGAMVESKLAQAKLYQEQELLDVTLQSIGDAVITTDIHGKVVLINKVAENLTGWSRDDASGRDLIDVFQIINGETQRPCENPVKKVLEAKDVVELADNIILIGRDGTRRVIADSAAPIIDAAENTIGVVLVFRDMTEKLEWETALRQSQKMESIGTLTGGIAHDFNNILGIIVGNTELALEDIPEWSPAYSSLEEIKTASLRATNIVKQLLSFSRKTDQKLQPVEVAVVIKDALKFMRSTIPSTIDIHPEIQTTDETILADPTQMNQIMMNLCINAAHAMEETGGDLTVSVEKIIMTHDSLKDYPGLNSGSYVRIMVSDTGPGIDPGIMDRIFDPYFTTKGVGKGSGMGLAVVKGIVENHNGTIIVDSRLGKGTAFSIFFPLADGKQEIYGPKTQETTKGNETILFVDDEISITKIVKRMFERLGYKVETTTTPQDALDRFRLNPDHFDLVITDMTMPNMRGDQLSKELTGIRPDIPIIICTGFSERMNEEKANYLDIKGFLMKPVVKSEMVRMVRKVLDEAKKNPNRIRD